MSLKVLLAYASKGGSTRETADFIGGILKEKAMDVEIGDVNKIRSVEGFDIVILGTAIRMGKPLSETIRFGKKYGDKLKQKKFFLFSLGITMKLDNDKNRLKAENFLNPLIDYTGAPLKTGVFAGKVDYNTLPGILKWMSKWDNTEDMEEGDWRNWEKIKNWTLDIIEDIKR